MKRDIGALQKAVIEASENRFWEEAVCEWEIMDCYIDENRKSVCICGQEGLKYCFTIQNRYNGNILYPIGSSCINQFGRNDLKQIVSVYEQMFNIRTKYYRREKIVLKDLSRRLLQFLYEEDISRSFFADSSYMLSFSVLCSCVCSRLISPSVSSWHKQDNTLMHQSPGHIQRRTPYNF